MSRPGPVNHSLCHGALGNYIIFRELGVQYNYRRYVHMFVNGTQRSTSSDITGGASFRFQGDTHAPN
jgi:hypothetical protein